MLSEKIELFLRNLVSQLISETYDVKDSTLFARVSADEIRTTINNYGEALAPLPEDFANYIDVYPVDNNKNKIFVDVQLWTESSKLSDLTLTVLISLADETPSVEICDLRVL